MDTMNPDNKWLISYGLENFEDHEHPEPEEEDSCQDLNKKPLTLEEVSVNVGNSHVPKLSISPSSRI